METQHVFKPGDTAFTIWGEEVTLKDNGNNSRWYLSFPVGLPLILKNLSVDKFGKDENEKQILYSHPVKVVPIPEFEEGEEIEVSNYSGFNGDSTWKAKFLYRDKEGKFWAKTTKYKYTNQFTFARKIQKPEPKTVDQLKDELIEKLQEKISLIEWIFGRR